MRRRVERDGSLGIIASGRGVEHQHALGRIIPSDAGEVGLASQHGRALASTIASLRPLREAGWLAGMMLALSNFQPEERSKL